MGGAGDLHAVRTAGPAGSPVLLFLHGAGGDHTVWGLQIAALRGRFGLIALDLPGHGRSPASGEPSIAARAAIVAAWIRRARASEPPVLVGHSMGGAIALQVALDFPDAVRALVLVGSGARLGVTPRILDAIAADPEAARLEIARLAYAEGAPEEMIEQGRRTLALCPPSVLLEDFRACNGFDVRSRLGELACPLLAVCGTQDRLTFPKHAEFLASSVPRGVLRLVPGAGHLVMIEEPEVLADAVAEFAGRLPPAGSPPPAR